MMKLALRLGCFSVFSMLVMVNLALFVPDTDTAVKEYFAAPEMCNGICLMGIRPHETSVFDAEALLNVHRWVSEVNLLAPGTGYGQIRWVWSGEQPHWIDATHRGRITFYFDSEEQGAPPLSEITIETITIYTNMRMPQLLHMYGEPDSGTAGIRHDVNEVGYSAVYHRIGGSSIIVSTVLRCPVDFMSYWYSSTRISLSIGWGTSEFVPVYDMVDIC